MSRQPSGLFFESDLERREDLSVAVLEVQPEAGRQGDLCYAEGGV